MAPFDHRDFKLFQVARLLSIVGAQMQSVAVGWQLYDATRRPLSLAYVGLAQFLPVFLLALAAGHACDRYDRRRILLGCHAGFALCSAALVYFAVQRGPYVWPIYAVLVGLGTIRAFIGPANQSLLPLLVPPADFSAALASGSLVWQVGLISGPFLGGILYVNASLAWIVYATAGSLSAIAFLLVLGMRPRPQSIAREPLSWKVLLAGVRYVFEQKVILGAISLDLFAVLLGGAVALLPPLARDILHVSPRGLGILRAAPAIGAGLTALFLMRRPIARGAGKKMFAAVAVFGTATIFLSLSQNFFMSVAALFIIGASDMVSVLVRQAVVQLWTPDTMRGRVSAVNMVFISSSNELGEFESGLVAEWFGVRPSILIGGVGTMVVVLVWAMVFRQLRNIDRLSGKT